MQGEKGAAGFTIIETILFFALSGLMAIGIIGSTTIAINVQRYRDAEYSLISYLQSEYDRVANVQNERPATVACQLDVGPPAVPTIITNTGPASYIGTSDCVVMGRLITFNYEGDIMNKTAGTVTAQTIYGLISSAIDTNVDDFTALTAAMPFVADSAVLQSSSTYTPEWGTKIQMASSTVNRLLIVRSPSSGTVRTFVLENSPAALETTTAKLSDFSVCLRPQGLAVNSLKEGMKVVKSASGQTGVQKIGAGCSV